MEIPRDPASVGAFDHCPSGARSWAVHDKVWAGPCTWARGVWSGDTALGPHVDRSEERRS